MSSPRFDQIAAKLFARVNVETPPPPEDERARAIAMMESAIRARARRKVLARRAAIGGAVAALAAGVGALSLLAPQIFRTSATEAELRAPAPPAITAVAQPIGSGAVVAYAERERALAVETKIARGSRIVARDAGGATLDLSTGTRLALEPRADLTVLELASSQRFALTDGAMRADVAKLAANERFVVLTIDAEVEVRGTSFRVAVVADGACKAQTRTRVEVFEGAVRVRGGGNESIVAAGESWPKVCEAAVSRDEAPAAAAPAVVHVERKREREPDEVVETPEIAAEVPEVPKVAEVPEVPEVVEPRASSLAAQNDLVAAAGAAKRRGELSAAVALYDRLLAAYPDGPLAETARVERMRALFVLEPGAARDAARGYLAAHPNGFAREEATRIAADLR